MSQIWHEVILTIKHFSMFTWNSNLTESPIFLFAKIWQRFQSSLPSLGHRLIQRNRKPRQLLLGTRVVALFPCDTRGKPGTVLSVTCSFTVYPSILWHQARFTASSYGERLAAGTPQALNICAWRPPELWDATQAETGLWERSDQGRHDHWGLDLHWGRQYR